MNAYTRVMKTLRGEPTDRVPVFGLLGVYGGALARIPLSKQFSDSEAYVRGQETAQHALGTDLVIAVSEPYLMSEAMGGVLEIGDKGPPRLVRPPAESLGEALALPLPDLHGAGRLAYALENTRRLAEHWHGVVPVVAVVGGATALAESLLGREAWQASVASDPERVRELLEKTAALCAAWCTALREAGVDIVVVSECLGESWDRDVIGALFAPAIESCQGRIECPVFLRDCAGERISRVLPWLATLPGLTGAVLGSKDDLLEARGILGRQKVLIGNLSASAVGGATREGAGRLAMEAIRAGAHFGRHLLAVFDEEVAEATPPENLRALVASSKNAAKMPLYAGPATVWICCSVFRAELEELRRRGAISGRMLFLDTMLGMDSRSLEPVLLGKIKRLHRNGCPVVLVYGECCPSMLEMGNLPGVGRPDYINCCQLLLGPERYRQLMREKELLLLPEWVPRWREIVREEMTSLAHSFPSYQQGIHSGIAYLDVGGGPVPGEELDACAAETGLRWRIEPVTLGPLLKGLKQAEEKARCGCAEKELS